MDRIDLAETVQALRDELVVAASKASEQDITFPVGQVVLEFQVGVTRAADAEGGVKFWVVELGAGGAYAHESVQKVTITLEPPVDAQGGRVRVFHESHTKP